MLVVEVISPSTKSEDTVRKSTEYLAAGVGQYWIVDRDARELVVYENHGGEWAQVVVLDQSHPAATVQVGEWGEVALDLDLLLQQ